MVSPRRQGQAARKPKLEPLNQWFCDDCGELILKPDDGWIEWLMNETGQSGSFRLVHKTANSPMKPHGRCAKHADRPYQAGTLIADTHLTNFVGDRAMPHLLSFIDTGPYREKQYSGPHVENCREWTELVRRLTIPYYEEARFYMNRADDDGFFEGATEIWIYLPETLRNVIELYGD